MRCKLGRALANAEMQYRWKFQIDFYDQGFLDKIRIFWDSLDIQFNNLLQLFKIKFDKVFQNLQMVRLEICPKIYTSEFLAERILHTENA